jgi:hypothetical protein
MWNKFNVLAGVVAILVGLLIEGIYAGLVIALPAVHPGAAFPWHVHHEKFVVASYEAQAARCIYPPDATNCARSLAHLVGASSYVTCTIRSDEVGTKSALPLFQGLNPGQMSKEKLWWLNNSCSIKGSDSMRTADITLIMWIIFGCIIGHGFWLILAICSGSVTYECIMNRCERSQKCYASSAPLVHASPLAHPAALPANEIELNQV